MHLVDISIVALNQREDLQRLLPTLMAGLDPSVARVMLLDNRSTDGTREYVMRSFPSVIYEHNPSITGYGGNHNLNLARSSAKYFLVLNADMVVTFEQIMMLVRHMEQDKDVVLSTGRVNGEDGADQGLVKRYPSIAVLFARLTGATRWFPVFGAMNQRYETRDLGYQCTREAEIISGAFMMARTETLKEKGGFDERFFLYFEDFDLCLRMRQAGKIRFYSDVNAVHLWHRDAHKSIRHTKWFISSAIRFFSIHGVRIWTV